MNVLVGAAVALYGNVRLPVVHDPRLPKTPSHSKPAIIRKAYADKVDQAYAYPFGPTVRSPCPGNAAVRRWKYAFSILPPFQALRTAGIAIRRRTTSGASHCTPIRSGPRSIAPASIFLCGPKALSSPGIAIAVTTLSAYSLARLLPMRRETVPSTAMG